MGSTRLPGKVLMPFHDQKTLLDVVYERCATSGMDVIVSTPDAVIAERYRSHLSHFEYDVAMRLYDATVGYDGFIRVCADNPFIMPSTFWDIIGDWDYGTYSVAGRNAITTKVGIYGEFVRREALGDLLSSMSEYESEHVTPALYDRAYAVPTQDIGIRLSIDTQDDFDRVSDIYNRAVARGKEYSIQWLSSL